MKLTRFIILLISISFWQISFAQIPATQENKAGFRSEVFGGLILHTNGWGGNFTYSKFKTYNRLLNKIFEYKGIWLRSK